MKNIETLERLIKKTAIPYGDLLKKAERGGMFVKKNDNVVLVIDKNQKQMTLYFESADIYRKNLDCGLIKTEYNY